MHRAAQAPIGLTALQFQPQLLGVLGDDGVFRDTASLGLCSSSPPEPKLKFQGGGHLDSHLFTCPEDSRAAHSSKPALT